VLGVQVAVSWSYLIAHVVDYSDGASDELREDFVAFYAAGTMVGVGIGGAIYQPQAVAFVEQAILGRPAGRETGLAFMNPPFVAGLIEPLTELSYGKAQAVWFGISVLAVAISLAALQPELRKMGGGRAAIFALAALASFPVYASLLYGQLSPLVLLSWVIFYRLSVSGRYGRAGIALAASLIKPQLAFVPLLYLVTTRRWRALGGFVVGAAVLAGVSVLLAGGKTTFVEYPAMLARSIGWRQEFGMNRPNMFGWNAFLTRVLPPDDQMVILLLTLLTSAVTLFLAILVWRRQPDLDDGSRPALALAAATILASPHMHQHDLEILLLPAALLAAYRRDSAGLAVPAVLLFVLPLATIGPNLAPPLLAAVLLVVVARSLGPHLTLVPALTRATSAGPWNRAVGMLPSVHRAEPPLEAVGRE
jgi:hypothetical protein